MDTGQDNNDSDCGDAKMRPIQKTNNKSSRKYINLRLGSQKLIVTSSEQKTVYLFVSSWRRGINGRLL